MFPTNVRLILGMLNLIVALASALPCLMVGVMSMDSPQAQNSSWAHVTCYCILCFPILCVATGITSIFVPKLDVVSLMPILAVVIIFVLIVVF